MICCSSSHVVVAIGCIILFIFTTVVVMNFVYAVVFLVVFVAISADIKVVFILYLAVKQYL